MRQRTLRLLRWSERYTKMDMVYLGKSGFWLGLGQVVSSLSGLILAIVCANFLPPLVFGTYKFVLSVSALIAIPTFSGLNTALIRALAQQHDRTIMATIRLKLEWGCIAFLSGIVVATYYFLHDNTTLAIAFFIAAACIPFMELGSLFSAILVGKKEFSRHTAYQAILYGSVTIGLCLVVFLSSNIFFILLTYFGLWTLGRLSALYFVTRPYVNTPTAVSAEALSLGKHLSVIGILNTVASNIDQIILFHLLGPVSVARYAMALSPILHISGFVQVLKPLSIATFSGYASPMTLPSYVRKLSLLFISLLAIILAYILLVPLLFRLLFPLYTDAIFYTQVLSLGVIGTASVLNSSVLIAVNAKRQLYIQTIAVNTVQIALVSVGAYTFGIEGVVVAFVISKIFSVTLGTVQTLFLLAAKQPAVV